MLGEILIRAAIGGLTVSSFAILGDILKPKSFAGLFGAAPSIALATLFLTIAKDGKAYAAVEARSMIAGSVAFCAYAAIMSYMLNQGKWSALRVALSALPIWCISALGLWLMFLR